MTFMWLCPYYLWFLIRSRSVFFLVQIIIIINTIIGRMQNMYSLNVIGDSVREMQSCFYTFNVKNSLNVCDDVTQYITCTQCNCWFMWLNGKHCRNHIWMRTLFCGDEPTSFIYISIFYFQHLGFEVKKCISFTMFWFKHRKSNQNWEFQKPIQFSSRFS